MTSNEYIVRNCPCIKHSDEIELDNRCMSTQDNKLFFCENNADCIIKQVIEKCKNTCRKRCTNDCLGTKKHCGYGEILQLFDIEEINK